jgi:DNA modification methylase
VQVRHSHAFIAQCGTVKKLPDDKKVTLPSVIEQETDTEHDHQKPAKLIAEHLEHWTPAGKGFVLDPFSGSGSTIIACEMIGRRSAACEINPAYVDVAVERWQKFTGKQAKLESNGETFDSIAATQST